MDKPGYIKIEFFEESENAAMLGLRLVDGDKVLTRQVNLEARRIF